MHETYCNIDLFNYITSMFCIVIKNESDIWHDKNDIVEGGHNLDVGIRFPNFFLSNHGDRSDHMETRL